MTITFAEWLALPFVAAWLLVQFVAHPFYKVYAGLMFAVAAWASGCRSPRRFARLMLAWFRSNALEMSLRWVRGGEEVGTVVWCPREFPPIRRHLWSHP